MNLHPGGAVAAALPGILEGRPMQEMVMGSKDVNAELEAVLEKMAKRFDHVYEYFAWGYELFQSGAHSWEGGCKHGYWLARLDYFEMGSAAMAMLRESIEELDFVGGVGVVEYEVEAEAAGGVPLKGEQWCISFVPRIFYDHRGGEEEEEED